MVSVKRISKGYKGVFCVERKGERILCIIYRKPGDTSSMKRSLEPALRVGHPPELMQNALAESMVKS